MSHAASLPASGLAESALARHVAAPRRAAVLLLLACLALFLPGFATMPPMDRDEPRFAQATKQMLESGDFVDIRFQGEARHKKPVGIYWLQAAAVSAGEALGVPAARTTIWLYRLPSLIAAIAAVLLVWWCGLAMLTPAGAFVAALLFASTILLGVEARLAKTDATVTATAAAAMGALLRVRLGLATGRARLSLPAIFWTAIAVGILVKGPITPMIPAFAAAALSIRDRSARWLLALRPVAGLAWTALIVAPWLALILIKTKGSFLADSVGADMLGKVAQGQESHGAPPGTYLVAFWGTAWPLAPFAALAAPFVWRARREPEVAFLIAWLVPAWLLFEATPTKLPHYVLPLYPALALAVALAMQRGAMAAGGRARAALALLVVVPAGLTAAAIGAGAHFGTLAQWIGVAPALLAGVAILMAVAAFLAAGRRDFMRASVSAAASALALYLLAYGALISGPFFEPFRLSPRLAREARLAAADLRDCPDGLKLATTTYREPSLVFLTATDLTMTDAAGAARFLAGGRCRAAFVEARREEEFRAALAPKSPDFVVELATRVGGLNLNGGWRLDIGVYLRK
ncbi:MAG: glycosyltransferase family 39 protein [Methylobacteriaceae bacterium]|nr:glycosyltransferase family 39 protein [Methylobacteriaceae bacterium]